jgi:hypothetical protein
MDVPAAVRSEMAKMPLATTRLELLMEPLEVRANVPAWISVSPE